MILRFAKLLLAHPDEISALKKIAAWFKECFDSLVSVLKSFEVYETNDCADNLDRIKFLVESVKKVMEANKTEKLVTTHKNLSL